MTFLLLYCLGSARAAVAPKDSLLANGITIATDPIVSADTADCIIPFSRAGNLILIKAKVDSTEGNFILDTGCPGLVLNLTYFRNYPTTFHGEEEQAGITGISSSVSRTIVKELTLGTIHYFKAEADVLNLGHIENSKGVKILGLLGMQLFKQCEMIIDYEKNLIYLHHIARKESATYKHEMLKDSSVYTVFPIDITDNRILFKTELAGKKLKLVIDCAAESNILDSRLPNKVFEQITINQRVLLTGSGNKKVEALYGNLNQLKIGNRVIDNLPVVITNLEKTCFSFDGCVDGVLGFDFMSLHKIGFNFVNNKMFIWK
jgi:hypothetical protein